MKEYQVSFEDKIKVLEASIKILNCDEKTKLEMMRKFCIQEGINPSFLLSSVLKKHDSAPQRASDLLKKFGSAISSINFYRRLEAKGYVEKDIYFSGKKRRRWILIGFGLRYGQNLQPEKKSKNEAFFYEDTFGELLEFINA